MTDETPPPAETPAATPALTVAPGSGLPSTTAAGLACLFPLIGGLVFLFLDRKDAFVRYYSIQSIVLGGILAVSSMTLSMGTMMFGPMPLIGWLIVFVLKAIFLVVYLVWIVIWAIVTFSAFRGKRWQVPYLATLLKRYSSRLP